MTSRGRRGWDCAWTVSGLLFRTLLLPFRLLLLLLLDEEMSSSLFMERNQLFSISRVDYRRCKGRKRVRTKRWGLGKRVKMCIEVCMMVTPQQASAMLTVIFILFFGGKKIRVVRLSQATCSYR